MNQKKRSHVRRSHYRPPARPVQDTLKKEEKRAVQKQLSRSTAPSGRPKKSARPDSYLNEPQHKRQSSRLILNPGMFLRAGGLAVLLLLVFVSVLVIKRVHPFYQNKAQQTAAQKEEQEKNPVTFLEMEAAVKEVPFNPHAVESTMPANLINSTEIQVDGTTLANVSDYTPANTIEFGAGNTYTKVDGIVGFRGNNFRDTATYGTVSLKNKTLASKWSRDTGSLSSGGTVWTGSGWTGQPLMEKWSPEVKAHMNMYQWAKDKDDLVEVIYACMDGYVYFLDLETGEDTREPLYLGYTFKGSGALDPRGYPILYVGAGYNSDNGPAKVFIVNLLDCSTMYSFGDGDEFSLRGNLSFFDSSALVDAETDTLIYPGENGILYLIRLNTQYDPAGGTLSIAPSNIVKWHYYGTRSSTENFWVGMEDSAAVYKGYLFVADNGGNLMCLDLNTLQLVWVQDVLDDSNSSPVLSVENDHLYLYVSTSFRLGWRASDTATVPIWKIDAETGEIVWHTDYQCSTQDGVSGGVQSTISNGKGSLSDSIYVTVSMTKDVATGVLACLNKQTGEITWEHQAGYAWSSPVCVYDSKGNGAVLYCSSDGSMYLLDGKSGKVYDELSLSQGVIEASPAVYKNTAVVGTRDCKIWGVELGGSPKTSVTPAAQ